MRRRENSARNRITMIYTFRSKATGDLIMLGEHGDRVMTLLGREPAAR